LRLLRGREDLPDRGARDKVTTRQASQLLSLSREDDLLNRQRVADTQTKSLVRPEHDDVRLLLDVQGSILQQVEVAEEVVRALRSKNESMVDRINLGFHSRHDREAPQLLRRLDAFVKVPLGDLMTHRCGREVQGVKILGLRHEHLADRATTLEQGTHAQLEGAALESAVGLLNARVRNGDCQDCLIELAVFFIGHVLHGVVRQDLTDVARVGHELELRLREPLALDFAELHGIPFATEPRTLTGALEVHESRHRIGLLVDDLHRLIAVERAVDLVFRDALRDYDLADSRFLTKLLADKRGTLDLGFFGHPVFDFADEVAIEKLRSDVRVLNWVTVAHRISFFLLKS